MDRKSNWQVHIEELLLKSYAKLKITARHLFLKRYGFYQEQDVLDLVQETCFKAVKNMDQYEERDSFLAWAKTILRNSFSDQERRKKTALNYAKQEYEYEKTGVTIKKGFNAKELNSDEIEKVEESLEVKQSSSDFLVGDTTKKVLQVAKMCRDELTEKQRKVFIAHYELREEETGKPLKSKELSQRLSMPLGTLLPLLARAKRSFAKCINFNFKSV